jgi:hypothetical protein
MAILFSGDFHAGEVIILSEDTGNNDGVRKYIYMYKYYTINIMRGN